MPPPWSLTIHFTIRSNIDEMSIFATLQENDQDQETSSLESPSYSRLVFYILITVVGETNSTTNNIHLWWNFMRAWIWWDLSRYDWVSINWMVCSWANMMVIICFDYPQLKWMKQALLLPNLDWKSFNYLECSTYKLHIEYYEVQVH
jgi:hypothetical protein